MSDFVWSILICTHGHEPIVNSWHRWRPSIVNSFHNFSVFNLLTIYNQRLSQARVAYFRICRYFLDLLEICSQLCQWNVLWIYVYSVRKLKETFVHCSIWMGWCNLWVCVILIWGVWQVVGVSRWCDRGRWYIGYTWVVHSVNGHT
jgi:hypothetical protein